MQGAGVIKAKPEAVVEICASLEQRPRWDTFFEGGKLLEVLEEPNNVRSTSPSGCTAMTTTPAPLLTPLATFSTAAGARSRLDQGRHGRVAQGRGPSAGPEASHCRGGRRLRALRTVHQRRGRRGHFQVRTLRARVCVLCALRTHEPQRSRFVRATVHMSGFIIRPLPDNAEHSSVTYVFQSTFC